MHVYMTILLLISPWTHRTAKAELVYVSLHVRVGQKQSLTFVHHYTDLLKKSHQGSYQEEGAIKLPRENAQQAQLSHKQHLVLKLFTQNCLKNLKGG